MKKEISEEVTHQPSVFIGIDASLNSTGLVIRKEGKTHLYAIVSELTKKFTPSIKQVHYQRTITNKDNSDYSTDEMDKIKSARTLTKTIQGVVNTHLTDQERESNEIVVVAIEGTIMAAPRFGLGRLNDLVMSAAVIKLWLLSTNFKVVVVPPKSLKMRYFGNGNAKKVDMVGMFLKKVPSVHNLGKIDDVADAHALSEWVDTSVESTTKFSNAKPKVKKPKKEKNTKKKTTKNTNLVESILSIE